MGPLDISDRDRGHLCSLPQSGLRMLHGEFKNKAGTNELHLRNLLEGLGLPSGEWIHPRDLRENSLFLSGACPGPPRSGHLEVGCTSPAVVSYSVRREGPVRTKKRCCRRRHSNRQRFFFQPTGRMSVTPGPVQRSGCKDPGARIRVQGSGCRDSGASRRLAVSNGVWVSASHMQRGTLRGPRSPPPSSRRWHGRPRRTPSDDLLVRCRNRNVEGTGGRRVGTGRDGSCGKRSRTGWRYKRFPASPIQL